MHSLRFGYSTWYILDVPTTYIRAASDHSHTASLLARATSAPARAPAGAPAIQVPAVGEASKGEDERLRGDPAAPPPGEKLKPSRVERGDIERGEATARGEPKRSSRAAVLVPAAAASALFLTCASLSSASSWPRGDLASGEGRLCFPGVIAWCRAS
jgi:hypothetical protein